MEYAVIMAGGRGERFWPLSRRAKPKQLLPIISEKTMLEETIDRIAPLVPPEQIIVVTDRELQQPILDTVDSLTAKQIIAEPHGKNTCLAIGLAATELLYRDRDAVMIVLSSDHLIKPAKKLHDILREGMRIARAGDHLVTIGINPTRPDIGYGYIEIGPQFAAEAGILSYQVAAFREKPDRVTAQQYYLGRRHFWNSGMFVWSARSILDAIGRCRPRVREALDEYSETMGTPGQTAALDKLYTRAEGVSIDIAVLESAENVVVIRGDVIWDDVGSWLALQRIKKTGVDGNVKIGNVLSVDSFEMTMVNDGDGIVACFGVSDLVVVKTDGIVLVAHKAHVPQIKKLLAEIGKDAKYSEFL